MYTYTYQYMSAYLPIMWKSMDSVVFGSHPRDADADWEHVDQQHFAAPDTPSISSEDVPPPQAFRQRGDTDSEEEFGVDARSPPPPRRKPGGYDSRIEQILYENPELPILITDAGKSLETGGRYIVYTIKTGVRS